METPDTTESFSAIRLERAGACGWVILNRPDRRNAINQAMLDEIVAALGVFERDSEVRAIGIRGEGPTFCSGYDLSGGYMSGGRVRHATEDRRNLANRMDRMMAIWDSPKPVIAAIRGHCLGGGMQMASFCDLVVVTSDASIGMPKLPVGAGYAAPLMAYIVGVRRAKELALIKGGQMDAATALAWGWANWVVADEDLESEVESLAARIAVTPASLVELEKMNLNRVQERTGFRDGVRSLADIDALAHGAPEVELIVQDIREHGLAEVLRRFK